MSMFKATNTNIMKHFWLTTPIHIRSILRPNTLRSRPYSGGTAPYPSLPLILQAQIEDAPDVPTEEILSRLSTVAQRELSTPEKMNAVQALREGGMRKENEEGKMKTLEALREEKMNTLQESGDEKMNDWQDSRKEGMGKKDGEKKSETGRGVNEGSASGAVGEVGEMEVVARLKK